MQVVLSLAAETTTVVHPWEVKGADILFSPLVFQTGKRITSVEDPFLNSAR